MSCRPIESSACWTPDRTTDDRKPPIWRDADLPDAADDAALLAPPLARTYPDPTERNPAPPPPARAYLVMPDFADCQCLGGAGSAGPCLLYTSDAAVE